MGKTHSKPLAARHGMAGERHGHGMLCVNRPLLSLLTVQGTVPQSRHERNRGVKIRLLLLGIEIRLFNRSARGLLVSRKRCKQLLEICSRN